MDRARIVELLAQGDTARELPRLGGMARADGSKRPPAAGAGGSAARVVQYQMPATARTTAIAATTHGQRRRRTAGGASTGVTAVSERVSLGIG